MASQSLYRKWRSQTFADLIGQEAVVRTLLNAVREGRLAHAYLFCGPRGTGKTSTARLLAKAANCADPRDGEPCNTCLSCREITAGRSPDVIEIDAASNTGVDNIRDLRETVGLLGVGGRYRVMVIDEAHMLSTQAFNALLKTLEEPPPHIIFVLATTEAHKVLPTVVSRCQRFDFRRIGTRDIVRHLQHVAEAEQLALELDAAELLSRAAQGGMRDALSLLDQALAYCGPHIAVERVREMLGVADPGVLRRLIEQVAEGRSAEGLHLIAELVASGADLRQLNAQLAEEWRALMLARAGADVAQLMDRAEDEARETAALAARFSLEELTACARIFARNETPARGLPVPQLALELSFLECVGIKSRDALPGGPSANAAISAMPPGSHTAPQSARPSAPPAMPAPVQRANAADSATLSASQPTTQPVPTAPAPSSTQQQAVEELDLEAIEREALPARRDVPAPDLFQSPVAEPPAPLTEAATPAVEPVENETEALEEIASERSFADMLARAQERWDLVKQVCKQKSISASALLNNARPVLFEPGETPALVLQADFKFHFDKLREPTSRGAVEWALEQVLEMPVRIKVVLAGTSDAGGASGGRDAGPGGGRGPTSSGGNGRGASAMQRNTPAAPARRATGPAGRAPANAANPATSDAPSALRDAAAPYEQANGTARQPTRPRPPDVRPVPTLEEEVRADAVIQTLLRSGVELTDVRPLDDEDGE